MQCKQKCTSYLRKTVRQQRILSITFYNQNQKKSVKKMREREETSEKSVRERERDQKMATEREANENLLNEISS